MSDIEDLCNDAADDLERAGDANDRLRAEVSQLRAQVEMATKERNELRVLLLQNRAKHNRAMNDNDLKPCECSLCIETTRLLAETPAAAKEGE